MVPELGLEAGDLFDATSVYGYCGPLSSEPAVPEPVRQRFMRHLLDELRDRRVVTVFSRLHPLLAQAHVLHGVGELSLHGPTVSVDLTMPDELRRAGYSRSTRRNLRRLQLMGATSTVGCTPQVLDVFAELYEQTMWHAGAAAHYHLDRAYFHRLHAALGDALQAVSVEIDGEVAAMGLYTACNGIVQAHLGASDPAMRRLAPAKLEIDSATAWARAARFRVLHLGGGRSARADSLYEFKRSFSDVVHRFYSWRVVLDPRGYARLCAAVADGGGPHDDGFFPRYRRPQGIVGAPGKQMSLAR
jgi:hypothetical protein